MADFQSSRSTGKDAISRDDDDFLADSAGFSLSTAGDPSTDGLSVTTDALEDQEMDELEAFLEDFDRQDGQASTPDMADDLEFLDEPEPDELRVEEVSPPVGDEPPNEPNEEWVVSEIGAAEEWMATKTESSESDTPRDGDLTLGEPPLLEPEPDLDLDSTAHHDDDEPHFAELDSDGPSADPHKLAELDLTPPAVAAGAYSSRGVSSKDELYDSDYFDEGGERTGGDGKRRGGFAALTLAGLGLIGAAAALMLAMKLDGEAAVLEARLEALEQQRGISAEPRPAQPDGDISTIASRVDALAARIEAGLRAEAPSGMNETQQREVGRLAVQLGSMEARLTKLDEGLAALAKRAPAAPATPVARVEPPAPPVEAPQPASPPQGEWAVNLVSLTDQAAAADELRRLRESGIVAEHETITRDGRTWHRLRVLNFDSAEAARRFVSETASKAGYGDAWVGRR